MAFGMTSPVRTIGRREFDFRTQVAVMAVINRTPDSFHDRGATFALDSAVAAALTAAEDGSDWVDVGGVPFGRGPAVSVAEEIDRVVPVVEAIAAASDVVISVDTNVAAVAEAAIAAGAAVINDTSGLWDHRMVDVIAGSDAHLVLTHSVGTPRAEKPRPHYDDVVGEVVAFLQSRVDRAVKGGVPLHRLVVDPGHDLNKNTLHSLEITRRFAEIAAIGLPTLAAVSNKDFIGESIDRPQRERLAGSIAAATVCVLNGARIIRMHDVRASVDAARMIEAILGMREPAYMAHNMDPERNV